MRDHGGRGREGAIESRVIDAIKGERETQWGDLNSIGRV